MHWYLDSSGFTYYCDCEHSIRQLTNELQHLHHNTNPSKGTENTVLQGEYMTTLPNGEKFCRFLRTHLTMRFEIRDPRFEIRDPRFEIRDPRFEIRDPRFEIRDSRSEIRDPRSEIRDPRSEIRDPRFEIRDSRSEIRDSRFQFRH